MKGPLRFSGINVRQRLFLLVTAFLTVLLLTVYTYPDLIPNKKSNPRIIPDTLYQRRYDSLVRLRDSLRQIIKPFNPNYLTDYRAYMLGIDTIALKKIRTFRSQGKYFQSKKEFRAVAELPDSVFMRLEPYINIPVFPYAGQRKKKKDFYTARELPIKMDLNKAGKEDLMKVYGIGEKLSVRIIRYREKLGGYSIPEQLKDIYALSPEAYANLWKYFEIKTPKPITQKIPLNSADMLQLSENPYIDPDLAEKIYAYRETHGKFRSFEELKNIPGFPEEKFHRIVLYLELK